MKNTLLSLLILPLLLAFNSPAEAPVSPPVWGKTGHRVIGQIAQNHLSKRARKAVNQLLGGQSLADASNWADEVRSDRAYDYSQTWHYVNFKDGESYDDSEKNPKGDVIRALDSLSGVLADKNAPLTARQEALKYIIHFVGDLHQPLHVGRGEDKGGNDIKLKWFNDNTNLHTVWDSKLIDFQQLSYTEWAGELDRADKNTLRNLSMNGPKEWATESHELALKVYASAKNEDNLRYEYSYQFNETVWQQLLKGGVRLAAFLNRILG